MSVTTSAKYFVTGGAGFIGAHLVNNLLDATPAAVTVFDNFSTGRRWAFGDRMGDPRLVIVEGDANDGPALARAMAGHDVVYHLAANSDIAQAAVKPDVDFWNGTALTHHVLEAMRQTGVKRILYTSGSGVYGDVDERPVAEEQLRRLPISTYGASKLASECLVSAYAHMFEMQGSIFRFANVVGPHQTHGVAYDFILRLSREPGRLTIYGDGAQSKPYLHVEDVLKAFRLMEGRTGSGCEVVNVASEDFLTVRQIADIVVERMKLNNVKYEFTGGARGWKADVPVYRLDSSLIRRWGWKNQRNSRQAVVAAVDAMLEDLERGRLGRKE
jgi:UDP-glucose 4-epimerase